MSLKHLSSISLLLATALTLATLFWRTGAGTYVDPLYCGGPTACVTQDLISRGSPYPIVTLSALQDQPFNYFQNLNWAGLVEDFLLWGGVAFLLVLLISRFPSRIWPLIKGINPRVKKVILRSLITTPLLVALSTIHQTPPPPPPDCMSAPEYVIDCGTALRSGSRGWPFPVSYFVAGDDSFSDNIHTLNAPGITWDLVLCFAVSAGFFAVIPARRPKAKPRSK